MHIALIGPPGAGKGTQGQKIQQHYGVVRVSPGEILWKIQANSQHPLANTVKALVRAGELVPDSIVLEALCHRLQQSDCTQKGYLLDGFPRTGTQAERLQETDWSVSCVISLDAIHDTLIARLQQNMRMMCPQCGTLFSCQAELRSGGHLSRCPQDNTELVRRPDDDISTVQKRLEVFDMQARGVRRFYETQGLLHCVDAEQDVEEVWEEIQRVLEEEVSS